jgi:hypothetical protein
LVDGTPFIPYDPELPLLEFQDAFLQSGEFFGELVTVVIQAFLLFL